MKPLSKYLNRLGNKQISVNRENYADVIRKLIEFGYMWLSEGEDIRPIPDDFKRTAYITIYKHEFCGRMFGSMSGYSRKHGKVFGQVKGEDVLKMN